jgi:hypothetical protein
MENGEWRMEDGLIPNFVFQFSIFNFQFSTKINKWEFVN